MKLNELDSHKRKLDRPSLKNLAGKKNIIGVEIGVQYGVNAKDILEKYDIKKLYLVDHYGLYPSVSGNVAGNDAKETKALAHEYLKDYEDKIVWVEKFSWDAIDDIPDELDFVYIDGDHRKVAVERDLKLYYPKVKSGGLFAGHDYEKSRAPGVVSAVNEFFKDKEELVANGGRWDWYVTKK